MQQKTWSESQKTKLGLFTATDLSSRPLGTAEWKFRLPSPYSMFR